MEREEMKALSRRLMALGRDLGVIGQAGLGLLGVTVLFVAFVLGPLQSRERALRDSLERYQRPAAPAAGQGPSLGKLDSLYTYLQKSEGPTDWLAKLYGISQATGVELQSASYQTPKESNGRIERYEIVLPVQGSYPQLREFLRRALAEIPVLSLDQLSLKRESRNAGAVQAELHMTLHMVKP
jgi:hypothetical protein